MQENNQMVCRSKSNASLWCLLFSIMSVIHSKKKNSIYILCNTKFPMSGISKVMVAKHVTQKFETLQTSAVAWTPQITFHPLSHYLPWQHMQKAQRAQAALHSSNVIQDTHQGSEGHAGISFRTIHTLQFVFKETQSPSLEVTNTPQEHRD